MWSKCLAVTDIACIFKRDKHISWIKISQGRFFYVWDLFSSSWHLHKPPGKGSALSAGKAKASSRRPACLLSLESGSAVSAQRNSPTWALKQEQQHSGSMLWKSAIIRQRNHGNTKMKHQLLVSVVGLFSSTKGQTYDPVHGR